METGEGKGNEMSEKAWAIEESINESIRTGSTVVLDGGRVDTAEWVDLVNGLADAADDWVERENMSAFGENEAVREYWGVDDDGDEWRVHVNFRS